MAQGRIRKGVEKSIRAAVADGSLNLETHAAPLAMLRYMADFLDSPSDGAPPTRYVTPASFLSYCETLGLVPRELPAGGKKAAEKPKSSLGAMRGKFRAVQ